MKKTLIITLFSCLLILPKIFGQVDSCLTTEISDEELQLLPWYGNNAFLDTMLVDAVEVTERLKGSNLDSDRNNVLCNNIESHWHLPIQFWIYLEDENDPGAPTNLQLQAMMDELNNMFQNAGMNWRFFMQCPQFKINPSALVLGDFESFLNQVGGNNTNINAINIHIVEDVLGGTGAWYRFGDYIAVERSVFAEVTDGGVSTLAHEIGHYFGLNHTHRNHDKGKCKQEAVSRTRNFSFHLLKCWKTGRICEKNGDALCDTPADPRLNTATQEKVNSSCAYTFAETDNWGDAYVPDERNIMAYSRASCQDFFSYNQTGVMWHSLLYGHRAIFQVFDINDLNPDEYEPDDVSEFGVPRIISMGETQCHSFHSIGDGNNDGCDDPVDWLRVDNTLGVIGSYFIEIEDVEGFESPVEEVKVFRINSQGNRGTEISTTSTQNGSKRTFEITCSEAPSQFLIEVVRKEDFTEGNYLVSLKTSENIVMDAGNQICEGADIYIYGAPLGASISWTHSSQIILNTTTGNHVVVTNVGSAGSHWVQADITYEGCTYSIAHSFSGVGSTTFPPINNILAQISGNPCEPNFEFSIPELDGATSYEWSCESDHPSFSDCTGIGNSVFATAYLEDGEEIEIFVTVTVSSDCGASESQVLTLNYVPDGDCDIHIVGDGGDRSVTVIPNPTSSTNISIEIIDETVEPIDYQVFITNVFHELKYNGTFNEKINQIDISSFQDGIYYLHVLVGEDAISETFIVQN